MRKQTKEYVTNFLKEHTPVKILDVGSAHINGSLREIFSNKKFKYVGVDMRAGRNVDVVLNAHKLDTKFKEGEFDLVMCFDTLEHDDKFWLTLEQMKKVLKPGGWLLIGVPGSNCQEHDHPHDYWRFMPQSPNIMLKGYEMVDIELQTDDPDHRFHDEIYCKGRKPC